MLYATGHASHIFMSLSHIKFATVSSYWTKNNFVKIVLECYTIMFDYTGLSYKVRMK